MEFFSLSHSYIYLVGSLIYITVRYFNC